MTNNARTHTAQTDAMTREIKFAQDMKSLIATLSNKAIHEDVKEDAYNEFFRTYPYCDSSRIDYLIDNVWEA